MPLSRAIDECRAPGVIDEEFTMRWLGYLWRVARSKRGTFDHRVRTQQALHRWVLSKLDEPSLPLAIFFTVHI